MEKIINLLVLDDDFLFLEYFATLIKQNFDNICVIKASCLKELDDLLKSNVIDIACLDIHLAADESGIEASEKLKKINPDIPLIFITGYSFENLSNLNAIACLAKPIQLIQLKEAINKSLKLQT
jgi:two-component SAPR family response regulator